MSGCGLLPMPHDQANVSLPGMPKPTPAPLLPAAVAAPPAPSGNAAAAVDVSVVDPQERIDSLLAIWARDRQVCQPARPTGA